MEPIADSLFLVSVMIGTITLLIATVIAILLWQSRRNSIRQQHYDVQLQRAELESMRESFETRIYELTERMVSTEKRWRDTNHLLVSSVRQQPDVKVATSPVQLSQFLRASGLSESDIAIEKDLVFVLMPFHSDYLSIFDTVSDLCREVNLRCVRGDEELMRSDILTHILHLLVKARIVVAIIDGRNPNVFYELGIAHAIDKPTILLSSDLQDLPIDIKSKRLVVYDSPKDLAERLRSELLKAVLGE